MFVIKWIINTLVVKIYLIIARLGHLLRIQVPMYTAELTVAKDNLNKRR